MSLDKRAVDDLAKSIEGSGQIYSLVYYKQHPDRLLVGRHRLETLEKLNLKANAAYMDIDARAKLRGVSHEEMELLVKSNSNVQRQVPEVERKRELLEYARVVESQGTPREEVASVLVARVPFLSKSTIYGYLPEEYKKPEKVRAGEASGAGRSS